MRSTDDVNIAAERAEIFSHAKIARTDAGNVEAPERVTALEKAIIDRKKRTAIAGNVTGVDGKRTYKLIPQDLLVSGKLLLGS